MHVLLQRRTGQTTSDRHHYLERGESAFLAMMCARFSPSFHAVSTDDLFLHLSLSYNDTLIPLFYYSPGSEGGTEGAITICASDDGRYVHGFSARYDALEMIPGLHRHAW